MKPLHFVADVHLEDGRPEAWKNFFAYLAGPARACGGLYLLGDVFHAWLGDDDRGPLAQQSCEALRSVTDAGVKIGLLWGNHDFMLGRAFARRCGAELLGEQTVIEHQDLRVLLLHGDVLCADADSYLRARRRMLHPFSKLCMGNMPFAWRRRFARRLLGDEDEAKPAAAIDEEQVRMRLAAARARVLVHGHFHQPGVTEYPDGSQRWLLPAWEPAAGPGGWLELDAAGGFRRQGGWAA